MAPLSFATPTSSPAAATSALRAPRSARRAVLAAPVRAHQQQQQSYSPHVGLGAALTAATALVAGAPSPAQAFLGFGGQTAQDRYTADTSEMISKTNALLAMPRDDPGKKDAVAEVRTLTNVWVAKYRRDDRFAGKPSYGNMYSVLNAISGHYNSFGPEAPIPKKRLERITKELSDAEKLLSRNR
eukprot:CAMPEP_0168619074 /NCGR_PEP_ID=MMETSP0449_2-20121227/6410_1 /TAXON_ID=1082188 /ORGANISM="Strombidium rassoulzadegani, Strain ras09" /LENGTH=184 /DNA_ID=CAMNT_0008659989 /DNA_START=88 /DNA_END=643 /DNA_ORIENTATION=-